MKGAPGILTDDASTVSSLHGESSSVSTIGGRASIADHRPVLAQNHQVPYLPASKTIAARTVLARTVFSVLYSPDDKSRPGIPVSVRPGALYCALTMPGRALFCQKQ